MSPEDEELTAFHTSKGIYCYKVMPFGLKNAGATYQRAMQKNFGGILWKYQLKMNPSKCAFGVTSGRCQLFNRVMNKDVSFVWDEACHNTLESIKKYLSSSSLLGAPIPASHSHYMQAFTVHLIARADPTRYVMSKPVLTRHLAKWALLLNQYEIIYTPAKVVKGQAVVDFLADHPIPEDWEISDDIPEEQVFFTDVFPAWTMFFDGSTRIDGAGASVVFISLERHVLPYSLCLSEPCPNNVAEYQALIIGLQMAVKMKI
ncbi:unnamed protein product [Prunus armeniaca]